MQSTKIFAHIVGAIIDLAAHAVHMHFIIINKVNTEIIKAIPCQSSLSGSHAHCFDWQFASKPVNYIDVVDMLFGNMITR